jgi:acetoin utilization protein AcuC
MDKSIFFYSSELSHFNFGLNHPFKPERAVKTLDLCTRYGVINRPWMNTLDPEPLNPELLTLFHRPALIEMLKKISREEIGLDVLHYGLGTDDNPIIPGIFEWSLKASGATHQAMEQVLTGQAEVAFNPLGGFHHAMADHVQGFCYLNDINIAILDSLRKYPETKILYLDCDAHHGNGVQEAFYHDPRVMVLSLHETGRTLYPWAGWETEIGEGQGKGFNINIPLEPWSDDEVYALAFDSIVSPLITSFSPDIIVAQIGADTLISDPLTHLKLTNNGYQRAVRIIRELCPKIVALGGGGYDLYRTARCWTLAWAILNEVVPMDEFVGLVGGMMFGPEMEVGSLHDFPYLTEGENKEIAIREINRVISYLKETVFPIHGI